MNKTEILLPNNIKKGVGVHQMRYEIEMTENQLNLMICSIELFARSLMGQYDIVGDILADAVFKYDKSDPDNDKRFNEWIFNRDCLRSCLKLGFDKMFGMYPAKNDYCENLIDIWHVLRHQQWLNIDEKKKKDYYDVRSWEPRPFGTEPEMKIKRLEND